METATVVRSGIPARVQRGRAPALGRREALVFVVFAAWITIGVFLDGFAHAELSTPESFFTPWHGLLYSGVFAADGWIASRVYRNVKAGYVGLDAVPEHYGLSALGVALFPVAGLADLGWHSAFGIEVGIAQLLSPAHLLLLTSGLLMFSGPVRAGLSARELGARPTFAALFPTLLACALITAIGAFFLQYLSPFNEAIATRPAPPGDVFSGPEFDATVIGIASVLVATVLMVVPVLHLLRRFQLPFGSATFLITTVALLLAASEAFQAGPAAVVAPLVGGLVADLLIQRLRPSPERPVGYHVIAAALPLAVWLTYFVGLELDGRLAWQADLWAGTTFLAALAGLVLSLLAAPARAARVLPESEL